MKQFCNCFRQNRIALWSIFTRPRLNLFNEVMTTAAITYTLSLRPSFSPIHCRVHYSFHLKVGISQLDSLLFLGRRFKKEMKHVLKSVAMRAHIHKPDSSDGAQDSSYILLERKPSMVGELFPSLVKSSRLW